MTAGKFYKLTLKFPVEIMKLSVKAVFVVDKRTLWISADVMFDENKFRSENKYQRKTVLINQKKSIVF